MLHIRLFGGPCRGFEIEYKREGSEAGKSDTEGRGNIAFNEIERGGIEEDGG